MARPGAPGFRFPRDVPLLREHLADTEYASACDAVFAFGDEIGIAVKNRPAWALLRTKRETCFLG